MNLGKVKFWSDSQDVISWLNNRSRIFKSFVSHKIGKIHSKTQASQWNHIPSKQNPANFVTHPSSISDIAQSDIWFHGPSFLRSDRKLWPSKPSVSTDSAKLKEKKNRVFAYCTRENRNTRGVDQAS